MLSIHAKRKALKEIMVYTCVSAIETYPFQKSQYMWMAIV